MSLKVVVDHFAAVQREIEELARTRVLVGVPAEETAREDGSPITNAALAYVHNYGAPELGIPARPFMEPGIERAQDEVTAYLGQAGALALDGKDPTRALHAAGISAVNAIKATITEGIPPPLKLSTVLGRRHARSRRATTSSDTTPLISTGQLINSITHVVRKE